MFVNSESILFLYSIVFGIIKVFIIAVSIVLLTTVLIKGVFEDSQMIIENVKFDTNKDNRQFKLSEEEKLKVLTRLNTKLNRSLSQTDKASLNNKGKILHIIFLSYLIR